MIEILPKSTETCIGVRISGQVSLDDYGILLARMEKVIESQGYFNLLVVMGDLDRLQDSDADVVDYQPGFFEYNRVEKLAFVGEKKWQEWFDTEARRLLEYQLDLPPVSLAEYTRQLEDVCEFKDTSRLISFAIDNLSGEFVGWINLFKGDPKHANFSFGISIFRAYRRHGYAEDAVRLILRYGFYELRLHKCNSECLAINQASIRLHQKLGFKEEGRRKETIYMDGGYYDIVLFGLLIGDLE